MYYNLLKTNKNRGVLNYSLRFVNRQYAGDVYAF